MVRIVMVLAVVYGIRQRRRDDRIIRLWQHALDSLIESQP